jgi:subtilisin family serine protease
MYLSNLREITQKADPPLKYTSYIVYYSGDIVSSVDKIPQVRVIILSPYAAAIFVQSGYESLLSSITNISVVEPPTEYILTQISPLQSANIIQFTEGEPLDLTGTGVIVGIIDTGIDYLNKEFTREDDTSRVLSIWDQTIDNGPAPKGINYGSIYSNEQINLAIKLSKDGGNPYSIVPKNDTNGHGTQCAGIIGARGYGNIKGAAPDCNFIVVKLRPIREFSDTSGVSSTSIPIYQNTDIATAILYLMQEHDKYKIPLVIFLPISSNLGAHDGTNAIEELINYYSYIATVTFALGTGNQGNSETHTSGYIKNTGETSSVSLSVGQNQGNLNIAIWCSYPDKLSLEIASPSGQVTSKISAKVGQSSELKFLYENTTTRITYYFPEIMSGNELIYLSFSNISPGIWTIKLFGDYIVNGIFNVWIDQRPLSRPGTSLLNPDNFTTLTIPSTSALGITTACYNQNTDTIDPSSGTGFTVDNRVKPEITCGGVNVLTTSLNNTTTTISGSSAATAVLTGAIVLLYQWGIVNKNLPTLSTEIIKTLLIRGTRKRPNEAYPNPFWGYGILDLLGVFDAIRGIYKYQDQLAPSISTTPRPITLSRKCDDNIETVLPTSLLGRLKYNE